MSTRWLGAVGYAAYNYAFYLFGAALSAFFLLYIAAVVLEAVIVIVALAHLDATSLTQGFRPATPVRCPARKTRGHDSTTSYCDSHPARFAAFPRIQWSRRRLGPDVGPDGFRDRPGAGMARGIPVSGLPIPGLVLLVILGIGPLVVMGGILWRLRWAWFASLLVGVALVVWIVVQVLVIGYVSRPPLQLVYGLLELGIVVTTLLRSVRHHFR